MGGVGSEASVWAAVLHYFLLIYSPSNLFTTFHLPQSLLHTGYIHATYYLPNDVCILTAVLLSFLRFLVAGTCFLGSMLCVGVVLPPRGGRITDELTTNY